MKNFYVISLGGSLIIPDEIDIFFLKNFKRLILKHAKKGHKFLIIAGGGRICRKYNEALKFLGQPTPNDLDWMGINATWINAKLVQLAFGKHAFPEIAKDPTKKIIFKQPILVGGGWKPGRSSDGATVKYAQTYGASSIINLSNIDYVYTKDPKKFPNAKKIENITWVEFRKIIGNKWNPGANLPFDPTAAKDAQKNKLKVIIAKGSNLDNLDRILNNKPYFGTTIH